MLDFFICPHTRTLTITLRKHFIKYAVGVYFRWQISTESLWRTLHRMMSISFQAANSAYGGQITTWAYCTWVSKQKYDMLLALLRLKYMYYLCVEWNTRNHQMYAPSSSGFTIWIACKACLLTFFYPGVFNRFIKKCKFLDFFFFWYSRITVKTSSLGNLV